MAKKVSSKIQEFNGRRTAWLNVSEANLHTLRDLNSRFPLHEHDLRELLPPLQNTKCIIRNNYVFLVLILPIRDDRTREIHEVELDIILNKDTLITVNHANRLTEMVSILDEMGNASSREAFLSESPSNVLLSILEKIYRSVFPLLLELSRDIRDVEERMFSDYDNEEIIREVLMLKNNNTRVRKALKTHRYTLIQLKEAVSELAPVNSINFVQVINQTVDIWNSLEADRETIDTLHDTMSTLVSNHINKIMKILTSVSTILFSLELVATLFALNTAAGSPFGPPYGFLIVNGTMLAIALVSFAYFRKKRWI